MSAEERAPGRLAELGARYALPAAALGQLSGLLALLEQDARAPTAVRSPQEAVDLHIADALIALEIDGVGGSRAIVDIGSGAGLPGLALAVALPRAEVCLLESQARKCAFIEIAVARLGLGNARVECARAEEWPDGRGRHDLALARALAPQPVVLEYAAPLLAPGGLLVDWRGRRDPQEELAARRAADELGMSEVEVRPVRPFRGARNRHLHVFCKQQPTPERFPRRVGVARKRPLGAVAAR